MIPPPPSLSCFCSPKISGLAQAAMDLIEQGTRAVAAAIPMLSHLLKAELAEREMRSIHCRLPGVQARAPGNGQCMSKCMRGHRGNPSQVPRHNWNTVLEPVFALPPDLGTAALGGDQ